MAKGILVKKPNIGSGSTMGKISVTDGGGSADPTSPPVEIGTTVEFRNPVTANGEDVNVGNLVEFETDANGETVVLSVLDKGTVITNSNEKVDVAAGTNVLINGTVDGKVTVNGGTLVVADGSKILSKIESAVANSTIVVSGSNVAAKIDFSGASSLSVQNCTIEGKVTSDGSLYTTIRNCVIEGSLDVINTQECHCSGNTVEGKTNTPNNKP